MTDTDRKTWEQQQRSNRIVDKAQAVFFENGYDNTTLPAIADAAGYNKRTLYLYFKDKEEIFLAVVLRGLIRLRATLAKAIHQAGSNDSGLQHMARAFFEFSVHSPEFLDLIMIYESRYFDYLNGNGFLAPDSYRAQCQQVSDDMARMVTAAIEKGMEIGNIGKELAPQQLMLLLWGQIFGVMKIFRMRRRHFREAFGIRPGVLFEHFVAMVERALR
jgi:AcrR family transcriptional regulator